MASGIGRFKRDLRTVPERPYQQKVIDGPKFLRRGFNDYRRGIALLASALRKGESLTAKQRSSSTATSMGSRRAW